MDDERPHGQRLHTPAAPRRRVAAGEPGRVEVDGVQNGDAAPVGDLDSRLEPRGREAARHMGDQEPGAVPFRAGLDQERKEGDLVVERVGQQVVGVQVPHRVEDLRHLRVEQPLPRHGLRCLPLHAPAQQPQPLDRVHGVHRGLQGQMDVVLLQQDQGLVDEEPTVLQGQLVGAVQEGGQGGRAEQVVTYWFRRVPEELGCVLMNRFGHGDAPAFHDVRAGP
jgi:hypothetical protein